MDNTNLEAIVSLCKRRGYIYQGSEIYGGLAGTWDYGPLGVALKRNITNLWWQFWVERNNNVYGIDTTILMNTKVWEASGHVSTFHDPLVEDLKTHKVYRADHLLEDNQVDPEGMSLDDIQKAIAGKSIKSPDGNELGKPTRFNLMFKTSIGPVEGEGSEVYLRPETAQGMFVNFRNVVDSLYPDLPFGLAQIGRNFRNEISPRDFVFRSREFELMEVEYFIEPDKWQEEFEAMLKMSREWFSVLGLPSEKVHEREIGEADRAHYSKRTLDFEYEYPIGTKEIAGLAYRTDFDLKNHQEKSGKSMEYITKGEQNKFIPHVIEPTFGVDRSVLAVLCEAFRQDEVNGEKRMYLALSANLAPVKVAIFPLLKNKPELVGLAKDIYQELTKEIGSVMWDDNGNIGKRYRRQDEIGTPFCVTVDFQSLEDGSLTVRERDTTQQSRISKEDPNKKNKNRNPEVWAMREDTDKVFPREFFWGGSTAAHQVEGGTINQWSTWELAHAKELAQTAHQRLGWLPNWKSIKDQAEDPNNYVSGRGVDHYTKYKEDFDIAKGLNLNAFRFSIEWSRIEPEEGVWDQEAIDHYKTYIEELRKRHLEPFLNIWHWTMPVWFTDKGGFKDHDNITYFLRFVEKIAEELIDDVSYVITLNEPNVYTSFGYLTGEWPPQEQNLFSFLSVFWNLTRAHKRAYKILKRQKPSLSIGIATQLANIQAKRPHNLFDEISTKYMRYFWNWWFQRRIRKYQDFVGINYYFTDYYTGLIKKENPHVPLNDMGWYMEPEGLYPLLLRTWAHFKKPIFITENGLADGNDEYRRWWIEETIVAMEKALSEGVQLRGYFHWSLLDNFEWAYGYWPKFGLVAVDRKNDMKRTVRPSAKWFAKRISKLQ